MEKRTYQSLQELPLMLSMMDVASVLGISKAGAYTLAHSRDFPGVPGWTQDRRFTGKNFWTGWKAGCGKFSHLGLAISLSL